MTAQATIRYADLETSSFLGESKLSEQDSFITGLSCEEVLKLGIEATASKREEDGYHRYGGRASGSNILAQLTDRVAKRFSEAETIEWLCAHTGGLDPISGERLFSLNGEGKWVAQAPYEWDHVLPASAGGLAAQGNIMPLGSATNNGKLNKFILDYYNERVSAGLPVLFSSGRELMRFVKTYMAPYIDTYGIEFVGMTLNNAKNGMTPEKEIAHIHFLTAPDTVDLNGDPVIDLNPRVPQYKRLNSPFQESIGRLKSAALAATGDASRVGTIYHRIQDTLDEMFDSKSLVLPEISAIGIDSFKELSEKTLRYFSSKDCSDNTKEKDHGAAKNALRVIARESKNSEVIALANSLATWAPHRDKGLIFL